MGYTLLEFLRSEIAGSARLLTRAEDFRQIPIESVSVQELPVDDFIQKHELVLSTAVGCLENPKKFRELILAVKNAGAAALVLSFREPSYVMEPGVIAYADDLHLPLFSIPWELRFSEIQSAINRAVRSGKLRIYQTLQARLFDAYFESMPLSEAAVQIHRSLGMRAAITDSERRILAGMRPIPQGEECEDAPPLGA